MSRLSVFDIYKIGVGPSSSHTLGPWRAGQDFARELAGAQVQSLGVQLFGSLAKTGVGHGTDIAVVLGLQGFDPVTIPTRDIPELIEKVKTSGTLMVNGTAVPFSFRDDIVFQPTTHPGHPNTLIFTALTDAGELRRETYFSLGGGFIEREGHTAAVEQDYNFVHDVSSGEKMIALSARSGKTITRLLYENERCIYSSEEIHRRVENLFQVMLNCVYRGCHTEGVLPGGLNVKRRAAALNRKLLAGKVYPDRKQWLDAIRRTTRDFSTVNQWISCFALAVNEENAALGRVVTSPTNGAAGVIPAVLLYHYLFGNFGEDDLMRFFLSSGQIGALFKQGATISAAVGGCQAEVGVSSAMAAAGLTEVLGGSTKQVLQAAEIAMEHHLGLTCDPIGGLVQVPCIERNAMGAMKAITASNLALAGNASNAVVHFDAVVATMWETAQHMHSKYKETAEGGLAVHVSVARPEC
ncbi:L-serine dehydratase [Lewinella marina]|uniref:L-serine dehydratase n=1 Tax=Neolewinella marina TaxID=438751 RepID=A0A2G0CIN3_9BACT|nr:L-serine ammonia-lyase [Neolewinella marina]NJB85072.1 L-serine dehydratase [Neolewinella marina]PHK99787.1 L-serine ammonia-lyase [Neolewinella marina]